jgi:DNA-binding CsgD family transcriptional regulator
MSRPYLHPVSTPRASFEKSAGARITRISDRLVLVSVPVRSLPEESASRLTGAERAVVELARSGLSNAAIARRRRCSPRTVANQLASAYKKLGVGSRRELRAKLGP